MLKKNYPFYLANKPHAPNTDLKVTDKYSGETATGVALADSRIIDQAIQGCVQAAQPMKSMPAYQRQQILHHCVRQFEKRQEELSHLLCIEAGKPIRDSRGEVTRLIDTFRIAAEESVFLHRSFAYCYAQDKIKTYNLCSFPP